ncbi:MAG: NAD(P)-dependent oxidoreductase [Treponema sp.]|jgi:hypothetical protein|nr:NAD(P)-dependent oxidoreductase [Treponema sp.]
MRKKVVITGASGSVISRILPDLHKAYDLVLLDLYNTDRSGRPIEGVRPVDLLNPNRDDYRAYFKGADVIVHTAYTFSPRLDSPGEDSWLRAGNAAGPRFGRALDDIRMAYNVYSMAIEEGVRRVVVFSSNQAANYYEQLIKKGLLESVDEDMVPYSDNYYGWSKISEEALGHLFVTGYEYPGRRFELIVVRIGAPRSDLIEKCTDDDYYQIRRCFGSYLSADDEVQLVKRCIDTEDIRDKNGVPFLLIYGVSDNYNRIWSLRNARHVLGYEPADCSYHDYPERIKQLFGAYLDKKTAQKKGKNGKK